MKKRILTFAAVLLLCFGLAAQALADDISEGLTKVSVVGSGGSTLYGYTDQNGNIVIPTEYEELRDFEEGIALGKKNGVYYLLNGNGEVLAELNYDYIEYFNEYGYAVVSMYYDYDEYTSSTQNWRKLWLQYGDTESDELLREFQEEYGTKYNEQTSIYDLENFINTKNSEYFDSYYNEYDYYWGYEDDYSDYEFLDEYGSIRDLDYELSPDGAKYSEKGRIRGEKLREAWDSLYSHSFYGAIDRKGREVIPPEYQYIDSYYLNGGKDAIVGRYDRDGNLRKGTIDGIPMEYDDIRFTDSGIAVGLYGKYGLYKYTYGDYGNNTGVEEILPVEYDIQYYGESLPQFGKDGKYGIVGRDGDWIIPMEYDWIGSSFWGYVKKDGTSYSVTLIPVMKDGKYGCFDSDGNLVEPVKYNEKQWDKKYNKLCGYRTGPSIGQISAIIVILLAAAAIIVTVILLLRRNKKKRLAIPTKINEAAKPEIKAENAAKESPEESDDIEPKSKFCPNCGKPVSADSKFCSKCGKPLDGGAEV